MREKVFDFANRYILRLSLYIYIYIYICSRFVCVSVQFGSVCVCVLPTRIFIYRVDQNDLTLL